MRRRQLHLRKMRPPTVAELSVRQIHPSTPKTLKTRVILGDSERRIRWISVRWVTRVLFALTTFVPWIYLRTCLRATCLEDSIISRRYNILLQIRDEILWRSLIRCGADARATLSGPGEESRAREKPSEFGAKTKPGEMTSDPGTRSEDYRDRVSWPRGETRSKLRVYRPGDLRESGREKMHARAYPWARGSPGPGDSIGNLDENNGNLESTYTASKSHWQRRRREWQREDWSLSSKLNK